MKKLFLTMFLVLLLFSFTGCNKNNNIENNNSSTTDITDEKKEYDLSLTETSSFDKLEFKYPKDAQIASVITSMVVSYKKNDSDENLFRVIFGSFYGTSTEKAMEGFNKIGSKAYNGIIWDIYEKDGVKSYATAYEYTVDVIAFDINGDVGNFEEDFLSHITMKN